MSVNEFEKRREMKQTLAVVFVLAIVIAATVGFLAVKDNHSAVSYAIVIGAVFVLSIGAGIFLKSSRQK